MFRVVFITFFGTPAPAHDAHDHHVHDAPPFMAAPLWILALLSVGGGILFAFWHPRAEFEELGWLTPTAVVVALVGIAFAYLVYQRRAISADTLATIFAPIRAAALQRFWIDDIFTFIYRGLMLGLARLVGWVDRYPRRRDSSTCSPRGPSRRGTGCAGSSQGAGRTTSTASRSVSSSCSYGSGGRDERGARADPPAVDHHVVALRGRRPHHVPRAPSSAPRARARSHQHRHSARPVHRHLRGLRAGGGGLPVL